MSGHELKRNQLYQRILGKEELKVQRELQAVQLRKKKRNEHSKKKRAIGGNSFTSDQSPHNLTDLYSLSHELCNSQDAFHTELSLSALKSIMSSHPDIPFADIFDIKLVSRLIGILESKMLNAQMLALWILINVCHSSSVCVERFVAQGLIDSIYKVYSNVLCPDIIESSTWVLANIISDDIKYRDCVISKGIWVILLENTRSTDQGIRRISYWALCNLSAYKPAVNINITKLIIPVIKPGLTSEDNEIMQHCAWILFYSTEAYSEIINMLISQDIITDLIELLSKKEKAFFMPALKTIGNIASSTDTHTKALIDLGVTQKLYQIMNSTNNEHKVEAFFIFSNMLSSPDEILELLLDNPCLDVIVSSTDSANFVIRKHAITGLCNVTYSKSYQCINKILNINALEKLTYALDDNDMSIIIDVIKALRNLIRAVNGSYDQNNGANFIQKFYELEGVYKLEDLQGHQDARVRKEANMVLHEFFRESHEPQALQPVPIFSFN